MGDYIVNDYRVKVIKGCLSCRHKAINSQGERKCKKTNTAIEYKYNVCDKWSMMEAFRKAGRYTDGQVYPHCYEKFIKMRDGMTKEQQWLHGFSKDCPYETGKQQASKD